MDPRYSRNYTDPLNAERNAAILAGARMNMTPEQRRRTQPYSSENIPLKDFIIRK